MRTANVLRGAALAAALLLVAARPAAATDAKCEIVSVKSRALAHNPLGDPSVRSAVVIVPAEAVGHRVPIVYYLPGFGYSYPAFAKNSNNWVHLADKVAAEVEPMIFVIVDGHNRWGGSQYVNSPAQGNYADYVCNEIVRAVEKRHPAPEKGIRRIVAGHSSGGFGALRLGIQRHNLFDGVVALSPDSDFPVSHLPMVQMTAVQKTTPMQITRILKEPAGTKLDGDVSYALALSAAYAPRTGFHLRDRRAFEWLYDDLGNFRPEIWKRWVDNDPLTIVEKEESAFSEKQAVYLEGAAQDQYSANIGAARIFDALRNRPGRHVFYEPPGRHGDHVFERLQRGLAWVCDKPLTDIK